MSDVGRRVFLPLGMILVGLFILYILLRSSSQVALYFGGLIGLEILIAALWNYRQRFLPITLIVFLLAGTTLPLHGIWGTARWGVLGAGALAGFVIYMKGAVHSFGTFHLVAFLAVISALVSAMVSTYPTIALLKSVSLLLLFLYGAAGARLAVLGREAEFFSGLLWGCEILVYLSAFSYFVLRFPVYGNPNSLGVVMGLLACPVLLWGVIASEGTPSNKRKVFALLLCLLLLFSSYARAAIGAACLSSVLLAVGLRRYRLLMKGTALALLGAAVIMVVSPLKEARSSGGLVDRLTDTFLYKGKYEEDFFSSRESPWHRTSGIIREHPWFGTGFGTSVTVVEGPQQDLSFASITGATREHGNSYLAIAEWTGLLGVVPFFLMVLLIVMNVGRVVLWMRRTGNPFSPAVPVAMVLAGAVFHAIFEDWMFAMGYYMCVLFWVFAFVLIDVLPVADPIPVPVASEPPHFPPYWERFHGVIAPGP